MQLENLVSVSGLSGLYKVIGNRPNGLIIESLGDGTRKFVSMRRYQFTPLEGIGIYIDTSDTVPVSKVFSNMKEQLADNPLPAADASNEQLRKYFLDVLPNHDPKRVRNSDIKKIVLWYKELHEKGMLEPAAAEEEE